MSTLANRRNFLAISGVTGLLTVFASTPATALEARSSRRDVEYQGVDWNLERQFAELADDLSQLPQWLLEADPSTMPNFQVLVEAELRKINSGRSLNLELSSTSSVRSANPQGVWECAVAVLPGLLSIAVPLGKVVQVIRTAIRNWGSIRMAVAAIRRGAHIHEIGEDGVKILEELLGMGGAYNACRGLLG